jgi:hypothetical protein
LPFTGEDVPAAEGVPLGAQSAPQPELDDVVDVVELEVADTGAPPVADDELVVVEADVGVCPAVTVAVLVCTGGLDEVVEPVEVDELVAVPAPVVCPLPELPPQPAATTTRTSAATIRDTKRIGVEPLGVTAGPRALRARA